MPVAILDASFHEILSLFFLHLLRLLTFVNLMGGGYAYNTLWRLLEEPRSSDGRRTYVFTVAMLCLLSGGYCFNSMLSEYYVMADVFPTFFPRN